MKQHPVILFDGVCNLCNESVQFIIKHDEEALFKFASLQSVAGQELLQQYQLPTSDLNSFVLIDNGKAFTKSTGALLVVKKLNGTVKLLYGLKIVPAFIRDLLYQFIARNRYKWFGKKQSCMLPTSALQSRFLK
jgi:predicted DCC family thiol-disulfide oxidoreductase YuxK